MTENTPVPRKLSLGDTTNEDSTMLLHIRISDTDDLVMDGYEIGPVVEEFWGIRITSFG